MSGQLPEEERKRIIDGLLHYHQPIGAFAGFHHHHHPLSSPSLMTTAPPPGWTMEQHRLFLARYHQTYGQSPFMGQYAHHHDHHHPAQIRNPLPGYAQHSLAAPSSFSMTSATKGSSGPLLIQASRNDTVKEAAVVTPTKTPSPSNVTTSSRDWKQFSKEKPLVEALMELPQDIRQDVGLFALHIERSSLDKPWGLAFVNIEADRLLVSSTNWGGHVTRHWCQGVIIRSKDGRETNFDPMSLYTTEALCQCKNDSIYAAKLLPAMSTWEVNSTSPPDDHHLCPGDLLVAIDGHPMTSFGSLAAVTGYLKSAHRTTIAVARCVKAKAAAKSSILEVNDVWNAILPLRSNAACNAQKTLVHRPLFTKPPPPPPVIRNPLFQDENGQDLPYEDNDMFYVPEDGTSANMFLPPIGNFQDWLVRRKAAWRQEYRVYMHDGVFNKKRRLTNSSSVENEGEEERCSTVASDFWSLQGFTSFDDWMTSRISQWKMSYSWNQRKRKRIQQDCEEIVHISVEPAEFSHWLTVRRRQWRLQRRKRQRLRVETESDKVESTNTETQSDSIEQPSTNRLPAPRVSTHPYASKILTDDNEMAIMDDIIEAQEAQRRKRAEIKRIPIDIGKFFDASNGIPDDIIVKCFEYLERKEHVRILAIDRGTSKSLQARNNVWKSLCPSHWILPRRPRKPWHELYCSRLKSEHDQHQKRWDDLLVKCAAILDASDSLCKIEKIIEEAQKSFGFDVNYISGVVCERNSLLNLAVIHKRHKVTRWLVDIKKADIETFDRGNFTPLLNAAWEGDRTMVRYFLQKGADRSVRGTQHYSKAIAPPGFEGMTADQWADKRGHPEVAKLIRLGV
jgi:Ankyrin repeats (many copies)